MGVHKTLCVYTMGVGLTQMICNLAKLYCGYFRPFFLYYCEPNGNMECTGDWGDEQQSRKSFPSGHASLTTCGMLLFSYFLVDTFGYSAYKRIVAAQSPDTPRSKPPRFVRIKEILFYTTFISRNRNQKGWGYYSFQPKLHLCFVRLECQIEAMPIDRIQQIIIEKK